MRLTALASRLRDTIRIERPVADDAADGAGSGSWELVAESVPAEVRNAIPGRDEQLRGGASSARRSARILMRYRTDVTAAMRIIHRGATLQIVGEPVESTEFRRREAMVIAVEEYRPAGNPA